MAKAILIAVSDGSGGYGDFLFALKLSAQIKKYCSENGGETPPVYIVTQDSGKRKIETLKGHLEFDIEILTPTTLKAKVDAEEIEVGTLIEGPVFQSDFIDRIKVTPLSRPGN